MGICFLRQTIMTKSSNFQILRAFLFCWQGVEAMERQQCETFDELSSLVVYCGENFRL